LKLKGAPRLTAFTVGAGIAAASDAEARAVNGYAFSRGTDGDQQAAGEHLGIGGTWRPGIAGRLILFNGNAADGTHNPSSYTYPHDPQTGGSHPLTGGHHELADPGAYTVHVYQVLPTNLKAGGSRRGGSKYTPSTLPRPWIYPGTPQLDADALSSLRDKLQVCVKWQPARCDAMQEPARSASLTAAPTPPMLRVRAG
jgi:hypothetical protein